MNMKKLVIVVLVLFYFASLKSQDVSVGIIAPSSGNQGQEFEISITVNKADVTGFARLQLDVPPGFTVKAGQTNGSTFSFKDNKIRFLWMSLPAERTLKVSCLATADQTVSGNISIEGSFSYVLNNETQRYAIPSQVISFGGASIASNDVAAEQEAARLEQERQERLQKEKEEHDRIEREKAEREAREEAERLAQQYAVSQQEGETENHDLKTSEQDLPNTSETIDVQPEVTTTSSSTSTSSDYSSTSSTSTTPETTSTTQEASTSTSTSEVSTSTTSEENYTPVVTTTTRKGAVEYKVQVGAYKTSPAQGYYRKLENSITDHRLEKSNDPDGFVRYYIGSFDTFTSVDSFHRRVMQLGYSSFIIAKKDGNRITIKEAKEISGN